MCHQTDNFQSDRSSPLHRRGIDQNDWLPFSGFSIPPSSLACSISQREIFVRVKSLNRIFSCGAADNSSRGAFPLSFFHSSLFLRNLKRRLKRSKQLKQTWCHKSHIWGQSSKYSNKVEKNWSVSNKAHFFKKILECFSKITQKYSKNTPESPKNQILQFPFACNSEPHVQGRPVLLFHLCPKCSVSCLNEKSCPFDCRHGIFKDTGVPVTVIVYLHSRRE